MKSSAPSFAAIVLHEDVFVRNVSSLVALVGLVWEFMATFPDEFRYIWRGSLNRVKVLYLFARYFALITQGVNTWLVFGPLSCLPVSRPVCKLWFLFLAVCSCLLLAAIDIVVMLRVYVLWNRGIKIGIFLAFLLFVQGALVTTCTSRTIDLVPFGPTCDVLKTPHEVLYFMSSVIISQSILMMMTVAKRKIGFGQSRVVDLVVRDGAWIFVLVVSIFSVIVPYSIYSDVSKPHIVFIWPITLISIGTCRLIVNMQKVAIHLDGEWDSQATGTGIAFTSFIDIYDESVTPPTIEHNDAPASPRPQGSG